MKTIIQTMLVVFLMGFTTPTVEETLPQPVPVVQVQEPEEINQDAFCLAAAIFHEAQGESILGQKMVGHTILNRAEKWNATICQVVMQKVKGICQFSGLCKKSNLPYNQNTLELALEVLNRSKDPSRGATHFHATKVDPGWKDNPSFMQTVEVGHHVFYRTKGSLKVSLNVPIDCEQTGTNHIRCRRY